MKPEQIGEWEEPETEEPENSEAKDESEDTKAQKMSKDDEMRLLDQEFLLDPAINTRQWLKHRYVLGVQHVVS